MAAIRSRKEIWINLNKYQNEEHWINRITYFHWKETLLRAIRCIQFDPSYILFVFSFFSPFLVFHHFYHGPTLATNATLVLQQLNELVEQVKNQTMLEHHNETQTISLPESLVVTTRERPVLCLLLMLGTLWLGYALYFFKRGYVDPRDHFNSMIYKIYTARNGTSL